LKVLKGLFTTYGKLPGFIMGRVRKGWT